MRIDTSRPLHSAMTRSMTPDGLIIYSGYLAGPPDVIGFTLRPSRKNVHHQPGAFKSILKQVRHRGDPVNRARGGTSGAFHHLSSLPGDRKGCNTDF